MDVGGSGMCGVVSCVGSGGGKYNGGGLRLGFQFGEFFFNGKW